MMAAAVLKAAEAAGVHIKIDNGDLVLEADAPPPDSIVEALSSQKAGIIALLETQDGNSFDQTSLVLFPTTRSMQFHQKRPVYDIPRADPYDTAINAWLNNNPAPSSPDRCAWCFRPEDSDHAVVPFGLHGSSHTWLHGECWDPWQLHRHQLAVNALKAESELCHSAPGQTSEIRRAGTVTELMKGNAADNLPKGGDKP